MSRQDPAAISNAELWNIVKKHTGRESVARIPAGPDQLEEIEKRLAALAADYGAAGASVTPVAAKLALAVDDQTWERYIQGLTQQKDEKGNSVNISLDKSNKTEAEKQYIIARSELIKNYLKEGESFALLQAQSKDNRENGGSLWLAQYVYGYGQDKSKDAVTISLEDILTAAARIKERDKT